MRLMRRALVVVALLAVADPTAAETAVDLQACLDASPGADAAALFTTCVGRTTDRCLAGTRETTLDIAACLSEEEALWDTLLNRYWGRLKPVAQQDGIFDSLLTAQRAWLAFRDAECAHRYAEFAGGSHRVIAAGFCVRDLTARRAIDFYRDLAGR